MKYSSLRELYARLNKKVPFSVRVLRNNKVWATDGGIFTIVAVTKTSETVTYFHAQTPGSVLIIKAQVPKDAELFYVLTPVGMLLPNDLVQDVSGLFGDDEDFILTTLNRFYQVHNPRTTDYEEIL